MEKHLRHPLRTMGQGDPEDHRCRTGDSAVVERTTGQEKPHALNAGKNFSAIKKKKRIRRSRHTAIWA